MSTKAYDPADEGSIDRVLAFMAQSGELFDVMRIVDPVARKVLERVSTGAAPSPFPCNGFWSGEDTCRDCLAARAFRENRRLSRMLFHKGTMYLSSAIPFQTGGRGIVVELLHNLTGNLVAASGDSIDATELQSLFDQADHASTIDALTGLLDRNSVEVRLPRELDRAHSTRYPLSLVLISIDGFARLRSRHGDAFCDAVLRVAGEMLQRSMRVEQDWVARSSENSFLVVMRNTGNAGVQTVAERIRGRITRLEIPKDGMTVPVTASVAIHIEVPTCPTEGLLLPLLEKKVLAAESEGGDRVV
jgi:diguanylate cyclase (GGDEF)-like protein